MLYSCSILYSILLYNYITTYCTWHILALLCFRRTRCKWVWNLRITGWCLRVVSSSLVVWNLWYCFTPQTGLTFITHHQVMMGEWAETSLCQNIQARTPSLLTVKLLSPSSASDVIFTPSPPTIPPLSLLTLWQSWHREKFRAVTANVRPLRKAIY